MSTTSCIGQKSSRKLRGEGEGEFKIQSYWSGRPSIFSWGRRKQETTTSLGKPVWCAGRLLFTLHHVIKDGCHVAFSCRSERASQRSKRTLLPRDKASTTDPSFVGPSKCIGHRSISNSSTSTGSEGFEIETSLLEAEHKKETMTVVRTEGCVAVNGAGIAYREFSCEYPQLEPLYLQ